MTKRELKAAIRKCGSRAAFARLVGAPVTTVQHWCEARVPAWRDEQIRRALEKLEAGE